MTFIFNYKGKNYTEEEIAQRISAGIFTQSDKVILLYCRIRRHVRRRYRHQRLCRTE